MTHLIKKIHVALALLLITPTGYMHGGYDNCSSFPCEERTNCLPCEPDCCGKGFLGIDLLYWRAFESGLDVCVPICASDIVTSEEKVISQLHGRGREPNFKWSPGFRLGTGYQFASDWIVGAFWTHFHSHSSRHGEHNLHWNLDLDVIDLVFGYEYDLGSCFTLTPFAGLRGARIDQKLHNDDTFSSSSSVFNELFSIHENKEKFSGIGPLLGVEGDWGLGCGFSLYASASLSWLYGHFNIKQCTFDESTIFINSSRINKHLDANLAATDATVGIRWETCFCLNTQLILQVGLEHHRYFDYNRFGHYGDLSFDGVNFSAGLVF